jgi:hypothetical protein
MILEMNQFILITIEFRLSGEPAEIQFAPCTMGFVTF